MPWYWPFRVGDDMRFQTSDTSAGSIYSNLGPMPDENFEVEVRNYNQGKWRRGWLQSIVPNTCYGAAIGLIVGFRQARIEGRYLGRHRIIFRYCGTFSVIALGASAIHHFLVVSNNYRMAWWQPMMAGTVASSLFTVLSAMGTITQGAMAGSIIGIVYSAIYALTQWYQNRALRNFLRLQQQNQVPVHKITPELQPAYRAFLYDYRPVEETTDAQRRAILLTRAQEDTRLDATSALSNLSPDLFDLVNFPDWWPLKFPLQTEEELLVVERLQMEEVARRQKMILTTEDGHLLKHKNRSAAHRDQ